MLELAAADPVVNVFADYRARLTQLDPRWLGGEMWGFHQDGRLVSACHAAANLVPVQATPEALAAFAERAAGQPRRCATIVGPAEAVGPLWEQLAPHWSVPRETRRSRRQRAGLPGNSCRACCPSSCRQTGRYWSRENSSP